MTVYSFCYVFFSSVPVNRINVPDGVYAVRHVSDGGMSCFGGKRCPFPCPPSLSTGTEVVLQFLKKAGREDGCIRIPPGVSLVLKKAKS